MPGPSSFSTFATFMVIGPTSFFLGILYSLFPYDYPLLWSSGLLTSAHLDNVEAHLRLLHASPNLIVRILHIVTAIGLFGLILKLYKPTESNLLFDGGSLVLYMIAIVIYLTNIVKGLRIVTDGSYGLQNLREMSQDQLDEVDALGNHAETGYSILGREDNLKVLAASNTIAALVLVGVLALQIGQWYADRVDAREREKHKRAQQPGASTSQTGSSSSTTTTSTASSSSTTATTSGASTSEQHGSVSSRREGGRRSK